MKRTILICGLALGAVFLGCRDKASTTDKDTPAATGSDNVDTYKDDFKKDDIKKDDIKVETKSEARDLKDDSVNTGDQFKKDIDEEFKDEDEAGDRYGPETDSITGGKKGSTETFEDKPFESGAEKDTFKGDNP